VLVLVHGQAMYGFGGAHILDLPDEILSIIFSNLGLFETQQLKRVCRVFSDVVANSLQSIDFSQYVNMDSATQVWSSCFWMLAANFYR